MNKPIKLKVAKSHTFLFFLLFSSLFFHWFFILFFGSVLSLNMGWKFFSNEISFTISWKSFLVMMSEMNELLTIGNFWNYVYEFPFEFCGTFTWRFEIWGIRKISMSNYKYSSLISRRYLKDFRMISKRFPSISKWFPIISE